MAMALSDKLEDAPVRMAGKPCSIGSLLDSLPPDEVTAFNRMMHELGWSQARIYEAVTAEGHSIGAQSINRHRSRGCRCYK
jgi:hypothetical protein